jgi:transposase-like protein
MKNQTMTIVCALDLFFRGISLREVQQHLKSTFAIDASYVTIHNWIKKYVELIKSYTESLKAITSDRWHADETLIRVRGRQMVLWSLLDSGTRQLIAEHISQSRGKEDAAILFKKGKKSSKTSPQQVVTDGLASYNYAIQTEFGGKNQAQGPNQKTLHIVGPLVGKISNNKIERYNGSIKGRLRSMGHLNSVEGAKTFGEGYQIHYNFIREHQALNGRTPAEMAKISDGKVNWRQLIEKASRAKGL